MITDTYKEKLKNRFFGLLCEYEKQRQWERFLDTINIELIGIKPEDRNEVYYELICNVNALRYLSYEYFRSTIFDCMTLIESL